MRRLNSTAPGKIFFTLEIFGARDFQDSDLQERGSEMVGTKQILRAKFASILLLSLAVSLWTGCGGGMSAGGSGTPGTSGPTANGMTLTPSNGTLRAGGTLQFSAAVTGNSNQAVTWSVNGVVSGNSTFGTIDAAGLYHAPVSVPTPNSVKVQAVSSADKTLSASSPVTLENPIPVPQTVNPTLLPIGSFTLNVGGANFVPGATVLFGGTALATTVVSPTQLTATGTSTQAQKGMVPITVQNPDPGKVISSASLNVQVGAAGQVSVIVIPATAQIHAGDTFGFRTAVNGAGGMTAVKWAINGIPNGNATVGTITAGAVYSAPATVPSPNTLQVTATSLADTTASSTGTITLSNPLPVVTAVLTTTIPVGN